MGAHVTKLTDAYESANNSHNALVRDLDELFPLIQAEAERKRTAGDRWDRVEGRIESLIQSQRERNRSGPEW